MTPTTTPTTTGAPEQAGAELDRLVAEKVMGWPWYALAAHEPGSRPYPHCYTDQGRNRLYVYDGEDNHVFSPSTDIARAWQVVEKMYEHGLSVTVCRWHCEQPSRVQVLKSRSPCMACERSHADDVEVYGPTTPLAICRAALAALAATGAGAGEGKS